MLSMRAFADRPAEIIDSEIPWDLTDPATAEVRLSRLKQDLSADPEQRGRLIDALTQLARAQSLQGKLIEAERTLEEAERMLPTVEQLGPKLRTLLERGRLLVLRRTPMEAKNRFLEVWKLASEAGEHFHAVDAAQMMSVVETKKKKSEWTLRALAMSEASTDARVRRWCGPLHIELGWHFAELMQLPKALESFQRAATCFAAEDSQRNASMARCWMARMLRLMDRVEEALVVQQEVQVELRQINVANGVVFEEIGECLRLLKRTAEAQSYFQRAYDLLSTEEWLTNNEPARIKRLKTLGSAKQQHS